MTFVKAVFCGTYLIRSNHCEEFGFESLLLGLFNSTQYTSIQASHLQSWIYSSLHPELEQKDNISVSRLLYECGCKGSFIKPLLKTSLKDQEKSCPSNTVFPNTSDDFLSLHQLIGYMFFC